MAHLHLSLLGTFDAHMDGTSITNFEYDKVRALLAYLVVEADRPHRREILAGLLWPESSERAARQSLSQALFVLRRAIGDRVTAPPFLIITPQTLQFNVESDYTLDVAQFTALWSVVQEHMHAAPFTCAICRAHLEDMVLLHRGDFLAGFSLPDCPEFEAWVTLHRERLRQQVMDALHQLTEGHLACGAYEPALTYAHHQLDLDAWRESAHRQAMAAMALSGQRTTALAQYELCRRTLRADLGVDPEPATIALRRRIEAAEELTENDLRLVLGLGTAAPVPGEPPFKGLDFFDISDAALFFGREALTAKLVERVRGGCRFLAVVGASGSGKSSLVRAGLAATLQREAGWVVQILTPTAHPSLEKVHRIEDGGCQLFVVDQFEELFTLCHDPDARRAFVNHLLAVAYDEHPITHVVIALRADFYHHCAQFDTLRTVLEQAQVYIGVMTADELRRAMEAPVEQAGWHFEPGLVDVILHDLGADGIDPPELGVLPLLSHALLETWKHRAGRTLTLAGYTAAGRVHNAIAETAEAVYQQLDAAQRAVARAVFLHLTEIGEGTLDTRRRPTLGEILAYHEDAAVVNEVLKLLSDARLITTERETVQVAHEALIREWPMLRAWLDESRDDVRMQRALDTSAKEWLKAARDPSFLLRGTRLTQFQEWAVKTTVTLLQDARDYLDASGAAQEAREAKEVARRRNALLQASAGLAAQAISELDGPQPERGVLLTLEALERYPYTPAAERALAYAVHANRPYRVLKIPGARGTYNRIAWSPDGTHLAISSSPGKTVAILWNLETAAESQKTLARQEQDVCTTHDVAWSPMGDRLVTSRGVAHRAECHAIEVWDVKEGTVLLTPAGHQGDQGAVDWSPDGTAILTVGMDGMARIWDAETGAQRLAMGVVSDPPTDLLYYFQVIGDAAWSPRGNQIATGARDHIARVWDAVTGAELCTLRGHTGHLTSVTWSPDGERLATASKDGTVRVWDLKTEEVLLFFTNHVGTVRAVDWAPNGRRMATAGEDGTVRVWHATTGIEEFVFRGVASPWHVAWSPNSQYLAIKSSNVWVLDFSDEPSQRLYGYDTGEARCTMWSPDGTRILTHNASTAWLWDFVHGEALRTFEHSQYFHQPWSPDGTRILTGDEEEPLRIWDVETGNVLSELHAPTKHAILPSWSLDGSRIVACLTPEPQAMVWDADTGEILAITPDIAEQGALLYAPMCSPDGRYFVTGSVFVGRDTPARIWDATTGELKMTLESHNGESILANWSPEGQRVAVTYEDGMIKIWDVSPLYQVTEGYRALPGQNNATHAITAKVLVSLTGHVGRVWWVTWSPSGQRVASGGIDSIVRVWNAVNGEEIYNFHAPSEVATLDWSPNGKYLVAGGRYATPMIWRVWQSTEDLIAYAHEHCVFRELTPEERAKFRLPSEGT